LVVLASIGSTNQLAGEIARAYLEDDRLPPQLVLLARRQTNGRGRGDHRWVSPAGKGIYTSLLLSATDDDAVATLPLSVPVALCEALDGLGIGCTIKWPNDLMVGGRKLGGVLIEALAGSRTAIVGYGINGSQDEADLPAAEATSLRLATGAVPDLSRLAIDLARAVMKRVACSESLSAVVSDYRDRSLHRPGEPLRCRLGGEIVAGRFLGFDERGRLTLDTPEGERSLSSAELLLEGSAGDRMGRETAADGR
jgi:BirA family biotin operon repressor/biotin-[acetyl-CoA-carboxylase] ligase